jgi:hypothetical protein
MNCGMKEGLQYVNSLFQILVWNVLLYPTSVQIHYDITVFDQCLQINYTWSVQRETELFLKTFIDKLTN